MHIASSRDARSIATKLTLYCYPHGVVSVINPVAREIAAKVVFYGPGLSGKTTTLQRIYSSVKPERRGELISLATETDRTIYFDFLPLHAQSVRGLNVRFQLYTVPGQVFYAATRKLVLTGADGVVFVADSQESCADRNVESFESLRENLKQLDVDIEHFPIVLQFNKRDLASAMPVSAMSGMLNFIDAPEFPTNAVNGDGIVAVLRAITQRVISSVATHQSALGRADAESLLQKQRPAKPEPDGIASSVSAATARLAPVVRRQIKVTASESAARFKQGLDDCAGPWHRPAGAHGGCAECEVRRFVRCAVSGRVCRGRARSRALDRKRRLRVRRERRREVACGAHR